jgi:hypothetical protein
MWTDFDTITRGPTIEPTNVDCEVGRAVLALYREARKRDVAEATPPTRRHLRSFGGASEYSRRCQGAALASSCAA